MRTMKMRRAQYWKICREEKAQGVLGEGEWENTIDDNERSRIRRKIKKRKGWERETNKRNDGIVEEASVRMRRGVKMNHRSF